MVESVPNAIWSWPSLWVATKLRLLIGTDPCSGREFQIGVPEDAGAGVTDR
jgi:hypothetical protein